MINLIPPIAKKRAVVEYWVRTISLWAFLIGTALLLIATLFIPLNLYVLNQESYLATLFADNELTKTNHEQQSGLLLKANKQTEFLLQDKREYTIHELLPSLQSIADERVQLEEVMLNQAKTSTLSLWGTAITRQLLVEFRDELEKQTDFLTVDLPISNLIEENDAKFTIMITLATSTPSI